MHPYARPDTGIPFLPRKISLSIYSSNACKQSAKKPKMNIVKQSNPIRLQLLQRAVLPRYADMFLHYTLSSKTARIMIRHITTRKRFQCRQQCHRMHESLHISMIKNEHIDRNVERCSEKIHIGSRRIVGNGIDHRLSVV